MPPESKLKTPRPPLTRAQRQRRDTAHRRHYERRAMFPPDPLTGKRPAREAPRKLLPWIENATSVRVCVEKPSEPNRYLYLFQDSSWTSDTTVYRWYFPDSTAYLASPQARPQGREYASIYEAVIAVANAGYLDASW